MRRILVVYVREVEFLRKRFWQFSILLVGMSLVLAGISCLLMPIVGKSSHWLRGAGLDTLLYLIVAEELCLWLMTEVAIAVAVQKVVPLGSQLPTRHFGSWGAPVAYAGVSAMLVAPLAFGSFRNTLNLSLVELASRLGALALVTILYLLGLLGYLLVHLFLFFLSQAGLRGSVNWDQPNWFRFFGSF